MNKILVTLFSQGILISCSNDDDSKSKVELIGN